jgi:hypothetical protein
MIRLNDLKEQMHEAMRAVIHGRAAEIGPKACSGQMETS